MVKSEEDYPIILVGGSAGALEVMQAILAGLPSDFGGAVLIVLHTSPQSSMLVDQLRRSATLPVVSPSDGTPIEPGTVYVAPPDFHMLVDGEALQVVRGPRENHCRPAIDPLFRSAAIHFRHRVKAIVLSGYLDDGSSGSVAVAECGGRVAVQSPASAAAGDMPTNALQAVDVDLVGTPPQLTRWIVESYTDRADPASSAEQDRADFAARIGHSMTDPGIERNGGVASASNGSVSDGDVALDPDNPPPEITNRLRAIQAEVHVAGAIESNIPLEEAMGDLVPMTCPECSGPLWTIKNDRVRRYRCHTGHGYTAKALATKQDDGIEAALWSAMRLMQERANNLESLAASTAGGGELFQGRADESRKNADIIRSLLVGNCRADESATQRNPVEQKHA